MTENPVINDQLLDLTLQLVQSRPEIHDQTSWVDVKYDPVTDEVCGTTCCVAGHALILSGDYKSVLDEDREYAEIVSVDDNEPVSNFMTTAAKVLGLNYSEASALFSGDNTREDLPVIVKRIKDGVWR